MDSLDIDWAAVEVDYRPNAMSLRTIGERHGCTEGAIRKKAKKEGWVRDLSEKIKARADDLVRREMVRSSTQTESEIVNANAQNSATVQIKERRDVTTARSLVMNLLMELESQVVGKEIYGNLGELLRSDDNNGVDKLNDIYNKVISFPGRVDSMKKLGETLKTLIELERKVYKIDGDSEEDKGKKVYIEVQFV